MTIETFFRNTELDPTSYPAWRDYIISAEMAGVAMPAPPRSYPGYPTIALPKTGNRFWPSLDRVLARRRCVRPLSTSQPTRQQLAHLLCRSHGISGSHFAGPVPSAGGLQALEIYLAVLEPGWLPTEFLHYDRNTHLLASVAENAGRQDLLAIVPSLALVAGGSILFILVGDTARVAAKYGDRGMRFLLLEAGHLMQNLCLVSTSLGLCTVPLGGFFERELARRLQLLDSDAVLYVGICSEPQTKK